MNGRRRLVAAALTGAAVLTGTIAAGGCAASSAPHAVAACTVSHPTACVGIDLSRRDLRAWKFRGVGRNSTSQTAPHAARFSLCCQL